MPQILVSAAFEQWLERLRDLRARIKIVAKIRSMSAGNFGDAKTVGEQVSEVRIHYGPGYRLYYTRNGEDVYLLLVGGDKSTQHRDIATAKRWSRSFGASGYDHLPIFRRRTLSRQR